MSPVDLTRSFVIVVGAADAAPSGPYCSHLRRGRPGDLVPEELRITLPEQVAAELVDSGVAVRRRITRGSGIADVIQIGVDAVNTGSALVAIVVGINSCRRLAKSFLARRRRDDEHLNLTITVGGEERTLRVDRDDPDAEDRIVDFLLETLGG
jgi:hypothetical protein